jgi:hypothetical protein
MSLSSFPGPLSLFTSFRLTIVTLTAVAWSIPAFCGEIHDAEAYCEIVPAGKKSG